MADPTFHVLSLCSGVGMLDEGVRIALPEARTVGYVEREAFAAGILLARMGDAALEPAPVWCGPLEDFPCGEWRGAVDCITAGFPCQPWSAAGKQQGEADDRWLWPAIVGIIERIEPPTVFLENVPGLVVGLGLNRVLGDLAALGFDAEWCSLSAADVGAAHLRERIFILAVDESRGRGILRQSSCDFAFGRFADGGDAELGDAIGVDAERRRVTGILAGANLGTESSWDQRERSGSPARSGGSALVHADHGESRAVSQRPGRNIRAASSDVADADGGQREQFRRSEPLEVGGVCGPDGRCESVAVDADDGARRREQLQEGGEGARGLADGSRPGRERERSIDLPEGRETSGRPTGLRGGADIFAPGPSDPRWPAILSAGPWLAPAIEPGFRGLAHGDAVVVDEHRTDQLRAIGNGVVALQAGVAFAVLARRLLA